MARQLRPPDEVLVCDDASDDRTVEIALAALAPLAEAVSVLRSEVRLGVTANVERGLAAATGDIIVLADQDDLWRSDKLSAIEQWAMQSAAGGMFSDGRIIDADGCPTGVTLWDRAGFSARARRRWSGDQLAELLRRPVATGAAMALRRSTLNLLLPLPRGDWHDYTASLLLAATTGLVPCRKELIDYRLHGANLAGLGAERRRDRVLPTAANRENLARQIDHLQAVSERLRSAGHRAASDRIGCRREVMQRRMRLPAARWKRLPGVVTLLVTRRYHGFGQGWASAARDLLWR